jgi:glyoxylase-like metal-dependent hydrolase (beta-lactamase superfamily II)
VKVRADAIPLDGPLPGGREGASVVVEPIEAGRAIFAPEFFESEGGLLAWKRALGIGVPKSDYTNLPVPAYLIRHPGAGSILVDTGLHPSIARNPRDNMGRIMAPNFSLEAGRDVPVQLREKGLSAADVEVVILTHLHLDHASAISEFPKAVFVLSETEWEAATTGSRPLLRGYRPKHYDFAFDYRTVDFDGDKVDSYGPFGRTFDLFGDGSIRLIYTPGHTAGHISVAARLPRRDFLITGDVAYTWRQLNGGPEPYRVADRHNWRRSLRETQAYRKAYPYALIVPGHDPEFWAKLDERYSE